MITIKQAANGYIVEFPNRATEIYKTTEELFERLLQQFEGLTKHFTGTAYGKVTIERDNK